MKVTESAFGCSDVCQPVRTDQLISLLTRELTLARDLQVHLRRASRAFHGRVHPRVANLPLNLRRELLAQQRQLSCRLESLSHGRAVVSGPATDQQGFWALCPEDGSDCRSHLEALVAGYARFLRSTSEIAATVNALADVESARILEGLAAIGNRGLWFLEIYLEGLALRMDEVRLPEWQKSTISTIRESVSR